MLEISVTTAIVGFYVALLTGLFTLATWLLKQAWSQIWHEIRISRAWLREHEGFLIKQGKAPWDKDV